MPSRNRHVATAMVLAAGVLLVNQASLAAEASCSDGRASGYACSRIDLLARMSPADLGGGELNDLWGWTDPLDGREIVLVGRFGGVSFVDISDPLQPIYLGELPAHGSANAITCAAKSSVGANETGPVAHDDCNAAGSPWRDIKTAGDHAYIVSEADDQGMQVFALSNLRSTGQAPRIFSATAHYSGFGFAHNIAVNADSGFAYAVGTATHAGGLHFIDIRDPANPAAAGGFSADGYTHDVQCVNYAGPDSAYQGHELCFASNEDSLTVVDVSDKFSPRQLARSTYPRSGYTHQGWLSEDQRWFLQGDEFDESSFGLTTRTLVWDISNVAAPRLAAEYLGVTASIDHNLYIRGRHAYQSNYSSGLRVLDLQHPEAALEVAFFDTYAPNDAANFDGTWSNYPFFASNVVAVSDREGGLFLLAPRFDSAPLPATDLRVSLTASATAQSDPLAIEVVIENDGSETAADVSAVMLLPAAATLAELGPGSGTCSIAGRQAACLLGDLAAGEKKAFTVSLNGAAGAVFDLRASAQNPDQDTRDNRVTVRMAGTPPSAPPPPPAPAPVAPQSGGGGGACWWLMLGLAFWPGRTRFTGASALRQE